jgi:PAS domain S-box-containing protein
LRGEHGEGMAAWAIEPGRFGLILLGHDGQVLHANQPAAKLLGHDKNNLIGRRLPDLVHDDDQGWVRAELQQLLAGEIERIRKPLPLSADDGGVGWGELKIRVVSRNPCAPVWAIALVGQAGDRAELERQFRLTVAGREATQVEPADER